MLVASSESVLRHRDCGECLREHIAALAQRLALSCQREVHVTLLVEAVLLDELECRLCSVEPLLILLYIIISKRANEGETTLEPHRLCCVHERSVAVYASIDAAILAVQAVLHPERHDILGEIFLVRLSPRLDIFFYVHFLWL